MPIRTMSFSAALAVSIAAASLATPALANKSPAGKDGEAKREKVAVEAPYTKVETRGKRRTSVRVDAPYTNVDVDTKKRRVRINVPYFNQTISW